MTVERKAAAQVIAAGILWGVISVFVRRLSAYGLSAMQISSLRLMIAAVCLTVTLLIRSPGKLAIRMRDLPLFIGTGIISVVLFNVCYFQTVIRSEASIAVVLLYTSPVFVMLMSALLFHESVTKKKLAALVLTVGGCSLVSGFAGSAGRLNAGVLLTGIGAGFFYALYSIFGRYALKRYDSITVTAWTFLMGSIGSIPFGDLPRMGRLAAADPSLLLWGLGIAVVCTVLPYALYTAGMQRIETGKAAILVAVEPLVGAVLGILGFGESMDAAKLAGILLVLGAIILMNLPGKADQSV